MKLIKNIGILTGAFLIDIAVAIAIMYVFTEVML